MALPRVPSGGSVTRSSQMTAAWPRAMHGEPTFNVCKSPYFASRTCSAQTLPHARPPRTPVPLTPQTCASCQHGVPLFQKRCRRFGRPCWRRRWEQAVQLVCGLPASRPATSLASAPASRLLICSPLPTTTRRDSWLQGHTAEAQPGRSAVQGPARVRRGHGAFNGGTELLQRLTTRLLFNVLSPTLTRRSCCHLNSNGDWRVVNAHCGSRSPRRESVGKMPASIGQEQFLIQDCQDCNVYICDQTSTVTVEDCKGCRLFISPIQSSIFLRNCSDCRIVVACQQFRTRDCSNLDVSIYCQTLPIIEATSDIRFTCFRGSFFGLEGGGLSAIRCLFLPLLSTALHPPPATELHCSDY